MKTVLVTGANGNLGQYVCQSFAKAQWNIIAAVFHDIDDAALSILGASSKLVGDFSNPTQSNSMLAQLDSLDAVVHLVGGIKAGERLEDTSYDDFESMLHINLYSAFNLLHDALPLLKKRGGSIVTVGAKSALHPEANRASYSVAKAGLISLTQAIAEEGRLYNVRANVIVPSIVKTAANLAWATNGEESSWVEPSDVAQAIVSLCSDAQSVINGAILPMYGGMRT